MFIEEPVMSSRWHTYTNAPGVVSVTFLHKCTRCSECGRKICMNQYISLYALYVEGRTFEKTHIYFQICSNWTHITKLTQINAVCLSFRHSLGGGVLPPLPFLWMQFQRGLLLCPLGPLGSKASSMFTTYGIVVTDWLTDWLTELCCQMQMQTGFR